MRITERCSSRTLAGCSSVEEQRLETLVTDAIATIQEKGNNAYSEFRVEGSKWFDGDSYVFVAGLDGIGICHPANRELEGTDLRVVQDADGRFVIRDAIELLQTRDSAWMDYRWPRPGAVEASHKSSFMKKTVVNGKEVLVGAGYYRK